MAEIIQKGWLETREGNKFAPATLVENVYTRSGKAYDERVREYVDQIQTNTTEQIEIKFNNVQTQLDDKADSDHTHPNATTSTAGFMTASMVEKLNGIADGATNVIIDTTLSNTSTNPVQNKVIYTAIDDLTSAVSVNTSSIESHTTAIGNLQTTVAEFEEITLAEIQALFSI